MHGHRQKQRLSLHGYSVHTPEQPEEADDGEANLVGLDCVHHLLKAGRQS
jgi:hypothetical protein